MRKGGVRMEEGRATATLAGHAEGDAICDVVRLDEPRLFHRLSDLLRLGDRDDPASAVKHRFEVRGRG